MILIGLGANLPGRFGTAVETLAAALAELATAEVLIEARSRWYETRPVPASDQPWYVNGVAALRTALPPAALLARLHGLEERFGRIRSVPNAARAIDLDLLDYDGRIEPGWPVLPHPRLQLRAFVLRPLLDIAPDWRHPVSGKAAGELLAGVDPEQSVRAIESQG
jgi:2-amino-4-hydroxy-6-hydroxymethyldihydropteridine diphosphokinase